jgi:hypothetical protein
VTPDQVAKALLAPSRRLGVACVVALALLAALIVYATLPLLRIAAEAGGPAPVPVPEEKLKPKRAAFDAQLAAAAEAVNTRQPFGQIRVAARPAPPPERKPTAPTRYGGPGLIGMADNAAIFAEGKKVRVGETNSNVTLISLEPPWNARVLWQGAEFTISLFDRAGANLAQPLSAWQGAPPPPPPPPPPTPAAAAPPAPGAAPGTPPGATPPGGFPNVRPGGRSPGGPNGPAGAPGTAPAGAPPATAPGTPGTPAGAPGTPASAPAAPAPVPVPTPPPPDERK